MSGFGGGFGSSPPGPGGFGFGQAPAFGQTPAPAPMMFGSPPATVGTPTAGGGFGASHFGGGGFGTAAVPTAFANPVSFGMGSAPPPPSGGFGGFGAAPPVVGFGTPAFGGFGAMPFGSSPPEQSQSMMDVPNPFGSAPATAPVSFGMSSNVVMNSDFGAPAPTGFGSNAPLGFGASLPAPSSAGFGSTAPLGFGASLPAFSAAPPFGQTAFSSGSFGAAPQSTGGMTFPSGFPPLHRSDSVDMGGTDSPTPPMSAYGGAFHTTSDSNFQLGSLSPIPEDTMADPVSGNDNDNRMGFAGALLPTSQSDSNAQEDELAALKARLQVKKKRLAEKMKRAEGADNNANNNRDGGDRWNKNKPRNNSSSRSPSPFPQDGGGASPNLTPDQQARAERNLARFNQASSAATQSPMPWQLKGKADQPKPTTTKATSAVGGKPSVTSAVGGDANREDLATAKSLVGTCQFMCPDEELLRRQRENDIQLLEIPDPGGIHPPNWTLRNTAVKRFRRSAADYKLDVPEWVRPPDVLEEVCSYLEEWIMERDRQGPDRRFPQNVTPNSMDVYQFIWDRTRMIRKDFILQNYVGTGGACDARAVRCHERIARWHAMCEHQLSHIYDFVVMQSQQNIQELGQAMKTLNQYYDDSLGRAMVEVPDEEGRETRFDQSDFSHGCSSDAVHGANPMDYDGSLLNNGSDLTLLPSHRLIGKGAVKTPTRGTAEPEMRGLYILLTMNNDGGMEVMRYSAALYRERPEIYNSKPVQLALEIFKAKKDYNYVRFFRILKDPNTPYLFCCLMFKHVELMRKCAFRIMNKTYGAKKDGEPIYDAYPLKRLAHVLCFEDMDEARAACQHYSITVKEVKVRSSTSGQSGLTEVIFWRFSEFKEPKDPEKGTILPLRPRKMLRYIESKLNGATRLGVCRGQVSGEGASLSELPPERVPRMAPPTPAHTQSTTLRQSALAAPALNASAVAFVPVADRDVTPKNDFMPQRNDLVLKEQKESAEEAKAKEKEKQRLLREEHERRKAEKARLKEAEKGRREEKKRQEEELRRHESEKRKEEERLRQEEEKRQLEDKEREEKEHAEAVAREAARLKEEERQRRVQEEARIVAEAEAREKERLEGLRREEEIRQKDIQAEEERRRQVELERIKEEEEKQKLEAIRAQEEERKRQEELARKAAVELEERVDKARKLLLLRRWRQRLPRQFLSKARTAETVKQIDPTFSLSSPLSFIDLELPAGREVTQSRTVSKIVNWRKILNRILSKEILPLEMASMMLDILCNDVELMEHARSKHYHTKETSSVKATFLFKVGVMLPDPDGLEEESMYEAVHTWLDRCLEYGKISTAARKNVTGTLTVEVRIVFVKVDDWNGPVSCDGALVVIPPSLCSGDWSCPRKVEAVSAAFNCVDPRTPTAAYVLSERFDSEYFATINQFLAACIPMENAEDFPVVFPSVVSESALEGGLLSSLKELVSAFTLEYPPLVEQASVVKMASKCILDTLWRNSGTNCLESAMIALSEFEKALVLEGQEVSKSWESWPVEDFAGTGGLVTGEGGLVTNYFGEGLHLPTVWSSTVFQDKGRFKLMELHQTMEEEALPQVVNQLVAKASFSIRCECEEMLKRRQYRKCLQRALEFAGSVDETIVYLPKGAADRIVEATVKRVLGDADQFEPGLLWIGENETVDGGQDEDDEDNDKENVEMHTPTLDLIDEKPRQREAINDVSVFESEPDIFSTSRAISPVPPGGPTPSPGSGVRTPYPPGTVSPYPGVLSTGTKRNWMGLSGHENETVEMSSPLDYSSGFYGMKRRRDATYTKGSRDVRESSDFTKKLEALLAGEATVDMDIGTTTLAHIVRRTPLLEG